MLTKKDTLLMLFPEPGIRKPVDEILLETGMASQGCLKTVCWQLRKNNIVDLRFKFGFVRRDA